MNSCYMDLYQVTWYSCCLRVSQRGAASGTGIALPNGEPRFSLDF